MYFYYAIKNFDKILKYCYILINNNKLNSKFIKLNYNNQTFPVIVREDETGGYVVTNPAIEGCYSQGDTIEQALKNIKEATELCVEETVDL